LYFVPDLDLCFNAPDKESCVGVFTFFVHPSLKVVRYRRWLFGDAFA
jgi:hypothetical protein